MTSATDSLSIERRPDGVAVLTIDVPGESLNTLKAEFSEVFDQALSQLEDDAAVRALVIRSGKPGSFIAGADIQMLAGVKSAEEARELSARGQRSFQRLEDSRLAVVAAIHGPALGGGLELALACDARIASDSDATRLGLPESQLGLLPGAGGTQRLPRLVGISAALDMMLTGRQIRARAARKMGLVDALAPETKLLEVAITKALELADSDTAARKKSPKQGLGERATRLALECNPVGRRLLFQQARKRLLKTTRGNYPAQERLLDVVETGYSQGTQAGFASEARFFGELVVSPQAESLIGIFQGQTALKRSSGVEPLEAEPLPLGRVGVLGAGLMGAGVAWVTVEKANLDVRLKDQDDKGLLRGMEQIWKSYAKSISRGRISRTDANRQMRRVSTTTSYAGFERCDLVIEAVPEVLSLKHQVLRDVEALTGAQAIFASNTSSIPISEIAAASSRPERVVGMHYFSPVEKMPLLEVIATDKTAPEVTATVVELGKKQGKTVIVVNDGPGFYTSRVLAPYLNEAAWLLSEGVAVDQIDQVMVDWGYPVGPLALLDEVGVDVASKVGPIMVDAFGARMEPPGTTEILIRDGRLGRKVKRGFYLYEDGKKGKKQVDPGIYELLGVTPTSSMSASEIAERCALSMVNEAVRCLEEGILRSARDGDIGAIFGLGFPPFRGGPFRMVDQWGAAAVVARLESFSRDHGLRFEPSPLLRRMAASGERFYD